MPVICEFNFDFQWDNNIIFDLCFGDEVIFDLNWETFVPDMHDKYLGPYEIFPNPSNDQEFQTNDKLMIDDMVFRKIPYAEVANPAGGNTVTIG